MPPLGFTDEEINSISALASALPLFTRGRFLQWLASQLSASYPPHVRGPGLVYRLAVEVERDFLRGGSAAVGGKSRR
jgi:hypothetical protein